MEGRSETKQCETGGKQEETTKHDGQPERQVHPKESDGQLLPWFMPIPSGQNETLTHK